MISPFKYRGNFHLAFFQTVEAHRKGYVIRLFVLFEHRIERICKNIAPCKQLVFCTHKISDYIEGVCSCTAHKPRRNIASEHFVNKLKQIVTFVKAVQIIEDAEIVDVKANSKQRVWLMIVDVLFSIIKKFLVTYALRYRVWKSISLKLIEMRRINQHHNHNEYWKSKEIGERSKNNP